MDSGWVGLYLKRTLVGKLFPISRNWLCLGVVVLFQSLQGPRYQNITRQKIKAMVSTLGA